MSLMGLGRVKTKSDLVVMPSGRQIFAFFCSPHDRRAQNSGCGYTAQSFYTARVISVGFAASLTCPLFGASRTKPGHHGRSPPCQKETLRRVQQLANLPNVIRNAKR